MQNNTYQLKRTRDRRWGIYIKDRLLATVGSQEAGQFMGVHLNQNLSDSDLQKSAIAYSRSVVNQ